MSKKIQRNRDATALGLLISLNWNEYQISDFRFVDESRSIAFHLSHEFNGYFGRIRLNNIVKLEIDKFPLTVTDCERITSGSIEMMSKADLFDIGYGHRPSDLPNEFFVFEISGEFCVKAICEHIDFVQ